MLWTAPETQARTAAGTGMIGLPASGLDASIKALIAAGVRSFVLFGRNIGSADEVRALTAELRRLAGNGTIIAIDHEGGRVNRLAAIATRWPSPMAWAATGDLELARRASRAAASELASLGFNLNLAPVGDLLIDHRNPVLGTRCFSDDPQTAAEFCAAFIRGHREVSVGTTIKHFPGHGATPTDSHVSLPRIDYDATRFWDRDLVPFMAAVEAGVDCLMISQVWYAGLDDVPTPATLSEAVVRLARERLCFRGTILTDCMEMGAIETSLSTGEAVVRSVLAGVDLVAASGHAGRQGEVIGALVQAAVEGRIPQERLAESRTRLNRLRGALLTPTPDAAEDGPGLAREIAERAVTLVRDERTWLPLRPGSNEPLGIVTFPATRVGVEDDAATVPLVAAARDRHGRVVHVPIYDEAEGLNGSLRRLGDVDVVLVATVFATGRPWQGDVVRRLLNMGKRVIVVAVRDPFDLLVVPEAPCYLAAYDDLPPSAEAAMAIVFGERYPQGRLPVALPGLYSRGHALTSFNRAWS